MSQRFTCDQCGRSYKHKTNLCNHKREECGKPPSYFCPVCKKGFKKKQHLQRHLSVHGDADLSKLDVDPDVIKNVLPPFAAKFESQSNMSLLPNKSTNVPQIASVFSPDNALSFPGIPYSGQLFYPNPFGLLSEGIMKNFPSAPVGAEQNHASKKSGPSEKSDATASFLVSNTES